MIPSVCPAKPCVVEGVGAAQHFRFQQEHFRQIPISQPPVVRRNYEGAFFQRKIVNNYINFVRFTVKTCPLKR